MKTDALDTRRRWTILGVCALSLFLVGVDTTAVNVGLPAIGRGLDTGTRGLEWVVDAYTIVLAGLLISAGALADRFGRRRIFRIGLVVFGAASLACAVAPGVGVLVVARAVQGVGGSMLSPVALAIVVSAMPDPRERARAIGIWASVFGLSMAAGPLVGGAVVAGLGWRWVFWVNLPVVLLALWLTALVVPESRAPRPPRLDLPGQALLVLLVGGTVALLIEGPHVGWSSPVVLLGAAAVVLVAIALVVVERRRAEPLVDLALFRRTSFAGAVVGAVLVFVALSVTLLLNTLYLQQVRGWSAFEAGVATLPMAVGATLCAPWSGRLVARLGARPPLLLAGGFLVAGGLVLVGVADGTPVVVLLTAYLLIGTGFGFANAPLTNTAVGGLPRERAAVAGGMTSTARQVGAALGIAVAGGLVAGSGPGSLAAATRPGWWLVAGCGLALVAVGAVSARATPAG